MTYSAGHFPRRSGLRGFTLLELVVAMAMVAVMVIPLYASMRMAFRAKSGAEAAIEPPRTAELAMEYLRTDLQNVLPPNETLLNALAGAFEGIDGKDDRGADSDDVTFYSTADAPRRPSANGDLKMIELLVIVPENSSDHLLVRRVTRNLLTQIEPTPDDEVICRGVAGFNLRYYDGADWLDTWDSTQLGNVLPLAIEVTLELKRPTAPGQADRTYRYVRVMSPSCAVLSDVTP